MDQYEFGRLLAQRKVERHYGLAELDDDLTYAHVISRNVFLSGLVSSETKDA